MESLHTVADAGLYTDFNELTRLRAKTTGASDSAESLAATKEVAKQFESLFLQMMLKSMRDASAPGESSESDQTLFYQEMFDKQIALDLSNNEKGYGLGLAAMLEKDIAAKQGGDVAQQTAAEDFELIQNQINRSSSVIQKQANSEQE
jgi:flagellar protein FlgJ